MAQWKETLEPYVKVHEKVKTAPLNPRAGEDLIIGCVIISDAGPSLPTLITSQSEFISTYASRDLTKDYIKSLNELYNNDSGISDMAETMWLNGYRLAGSNSLLVVRASKMKDTYFAKPLVKDDNSIYLLRDGQLLKQVCHKSGQHVKVVVDVAKDGSQHNTDGWSININGVGIIGNRTTDDGAQYDYYVKNLQQLVDYLNDTSKFFSPNYVLYEDDRMTTEAVDPDAATCVVFNELYLGADIIDTSDPRCPEGLSYVITCQEDWTAVNPNQHVIDLNSSTFSHFEDVPFYATNVYNSSTDLKVRIRRFNHDAVITKELSANDAFQGGNSPYTVLGSVLDTFTNNGTFTKNGRPVPSEEILYRDFYEIAVLDPSVSGEPVYFNLGNILGRGDMTVSEMNGLLKMVSLQLPDDMGDLGLGYYGYLPASQQSAWVTTNKEDLTASEISGAIQKEFKSGLDEVETVAGTVVCVGKKTPKYYKYVAASTEWQEITDAEELAAIEESDISFEESSLAILQAHVKKPENDEIACIGESIEGTYYKYRTGITLNDVDPEELWVNLSIDPTKYDILDVSDTDILKAFDQIQLDEVYVTEGLTDLGCTSPMVQSYMANMAISEDGNYFYPVSTVNSTNYLAIANSINRISQDSYKLYASAPWDIDTGTVGWKYYASPGVLYWEAVSRNRSLGREFAPVLGQSNGIVQYQRPVTEFNKKTRQLLLSKRINTVLWNTQTQAWNMNDNYCKTNETHILNDDGNSRLCIRISKAMPILLRQFIGRRINPILWADAKAVIEFWMNTTILPLSYGIDAYRVTIDETNNPVEIQRRNQMVVLLEVRYQRALKYIDVYNNAFDIGMPFDGQI